MEIHVQNSSFRDINLIENYSSLIWTERYSPAGDFALVLPVTDVNRDILKTAVYFRIPSSKKTMVVETIEEKDVFTVKGRCLKTWLERRVVETTGPTAPTSLTDLIVRLLNYNAAGLASPTERQFPFFNVYGALPAGFTDTTTYDPVKYGDNLYAAVMHLCDGQSLGWDIINPLATLVSEFHFYYGQDLSYHGTDLVVFSKSIGNIQNVTQLQSDVSLKNVAVVNLPPWDGSLGVGEIWHINNGVSTPSGLARREVWTDASELRKDLTFNSTNKPDRAASWGRQELTLHPSTNSIDFEMAETIYTYGVDYNLGDIVVVVNSYGENVKHRVTEYIQSFGPEGDAAYPTLTAI